VSSVEYSDVECGAFEPNIGVDLASDLRLLKVRARLWDSDEFVGLQFRQHRTFSVRRVERLALRVSCREDGGGDETVMSLRGCRCFILPSAACGRWQMKFDYTVIMWLGEGMSMRRICNDACSNTGNLSSDIALHQFTTTKL